jgi:hypothetical protein
VLLNNYNSNGYHGVVADDDQPQFALSTRILFQDDVILPRYDANNKPISYSLEPVFAADTIDDCWLHAGDRAGQPGARGTVAAGGFGPRIVYW